MARESTISLEQVLVPADQIKASGGKPAARAVRAALGGGSMTTVLKFIQQWKSGQARASEQIDDILDLSIVRRDSFSPLPERFGRGPGVRASPYFGDCGNIDSSSVRLTKENRGRPLSGNSTPQTLGFRNSGTLVLPPLPLSQLFP